MKQMDGSEEMLDQQDAETLQAGMAQFVIAALESGYALPFEVETKDWDGDLMCRLRLVEDPVGSLKAIDLEPGDGVAKAGRFPLELKLTDIKGLKASMVVRLKPQKGYAA